MSCRPRITCRRGSASPAWHLRLRAHRDAGFGSGRRRKRTACGETGEICAIGPAVFAGYYDNPEANAKSFRNGWFRTGDLGYMDRDGYVYLTGRSSDMYISGGSNIYPREMEEKILTHERCDRSGRVWACRTAVGRSRRSGVCAAPRCDARARRSLLDWMSTRIARYKLPKQVFFWDELPKSGYGKVPKRLVKDELARRGVAGSWR